MRLVLFIALSCIILCSCETFKGAGNGIKKDLSNTKGNLSEARPMEKINKADAWLQEHAW